MPELELGSSANGPVPDAAPVDAPDAIPAISDLSFGWPFESRQWVTADTGWFFPVLAPGGELFVEEDWANPNSAPVTTAPPSSAPIIQDRTTGAGPGDPAGRANTSDPNSANSSGTNAAGRPANPLADPGRR